MLVLVTVTLTLTIGDNGIITKAREAAFKQDVAQYNEELQSFIATHYEDSETKYIDENGKEMFLSEAIKKSEYSKVNNEDRDLEECIPSYDFDKYGKKFYVLKNELVYSYTGDKNEKAWAESLGIESKYKEVAISFKVQGEGEIQGITEMDFTAFVGQELNVTAVAKTLNLDSTNIAFEFTEWKKNGETISTNANQTITITEEAEYTAVFEPNETLIYYNENDVFVTAETIINASTYSGTITDKTSIKKVLFGSKVTAIGNSAFKDCTGIKTVEFSDKIEIIGESAFSGCTGITKVNLNNVTTVNSKVFIDCSNLEEVIAKKIKTMGNESLLRNSKLKKVVFGSIDNSIQQIVSHWGTSITSSDNELTIQLYIDTQNGTVTNLANEPWGASNATIEYYDASTGELVNVILGLKYKGNTKITWEDVPNKDKITEIRGEAFSGCIGITGEITIPDKVTSLNNQTFQGCTGITKVNLNNVTTVNSKAFNGCNNLEYVNGKKVKQINSNAFAGCGKLICAEFGSVGNPMISIYGWPSPAFYGTSNTETIKLYIDTQNGTVTNLANEPWGAGDATIEYYDAETGNKIN